MKAFNRLDKSWDAEFISGWTANMFLKVLRSFNIEPHDVDIEDERFGISVIRFFSTEQTRKQIEYVFRRTLGKDSIYLMDVTKYMNNWRKWEDDNYVIY